MFWFPGELSSAAGTSVQGAKEHKRPFTPDSFSPHSEKAKPGMQRTFLSHNKSWKPKPTLCLTTGFLENLPLFVSLFFTAIGTGLFKEVPDFVCQMRNRKCWPRILWFAPAANVAGLQNLRPSAAWGRLGVQGNECTKLLDRSLLFPLQGGRLLARSKHKKKRDAGRWGQRLTSAKVEIDLLVMFLLRMVFLLCCVVWVLPLILSEEESEPIRAEAVFHSSPGLSTESRFTEAEIVERAPFANSDGEQCLFSVCRREA